ncbi:tripartite tricarboxylate transporter substrate binding protein [Pseudoroseomonas wenyumeiae]|uniref:Tripartite tricarboxylate transporter substrate binding protein n=1 Tax=Teichococcus wenyumeiae TaxID=2478470 RepID=A0A3A9JC10_9PROT|nr:tripartite tricarboxylate transporter substrate binding protein [Pseudoroseomonas wenyumeiae]RKK03680.1 tripartite tricarboxylate transporter substrate binding protein [Pseudoroseomonas wenyumeiae]RMI20546.1 tripartite tricarboxylate transporter substrate binding protein [Pseudoroseomonas wenyumeiae]
MNRRQFTALGAAFGAAALLQPALSAPALAQGAATLPDVPLRLVVPFPPGGPNDLLARLLAQKMGPRLKRNVVIENRSGAGGVVGTDAVAKGLADGTSMVLTSAGAIAISPTLMPKMPYDVEKDLAPITLVALMPELLAVNPKLPVKNLAELIAYAKKNPGKVNFASSGNGSMPHLGGESLRFSADIDIVHVPYRGAAPAVTDLMSGQVQMMFADMPAMLAQVQSGDLRPIAIAGDARSPLLPEVQTLAEAGHPDVAPVNWYGLAVPARTPAPIQQLLHGAATEALRDPELISAYEQQGARVAPGSPEEFRRFIAEETKRWGEIGRRAGATID